MHESTIDNVKLEQQLNSNSKAEQHSSSPNNGNTYVGSSVSSTNRKFIPLFLSDIELQKEKELTRKFIEDGIMLIPNT